MLKDKFLPSLLKVKKDEPRPSPQPLRIPRAWLVAWIFLRFVWYTAAMRTGQTDRAQRFGRILRSEFERLGDFGIKTARVLATERHAYPHLFCDELARIRNNDRGISGEQAKDILQQEIGRPTNEVFQEFDVVPVATSGHGQVHLAWLRIKNVKVAIKIQRPGAAEAFFKDLSVLAKFVSFVQFFSATHGKRLRTLEQWLHHIGHFKLDYRRMGELLRRERPNLKTKKVYVPKVFLRYCTPRVLVMEFIDGVPFVDYERARTSAPKDAVAWRQANGIRPAKLRRRMEKVASIGQPRSLMLLRNNRIALVDIDQPPAD